MTGMEDEPKGLQLAQASKLLRSFVEGGTSLNALVQHMEFLLSDSDFQLDNAQRSRALNHVYLLEEINALALDEGRCPSADEAREIDRLVTALTIELGL